MLLGVALCLLIYYVGFSALKTVSNFFKAQFVRYGVLFGIPAIIILVMVYRRRIENAEIKRSYLKICDTPKLIWKNEMAHMLRLADFRGELAAFATVLLPILIAVGMESQAPWWADIMAGIVVFCLSEGIFLVFDLILWLAVHHKWQRER